MAILTLNEAAKLVGKSKPTLWRAHKKGLLSMTRHASGQWRVDTSELLRVYGQFTETPHDHDNTAPVLRQVTPDTKGIELENASLKQHIASLESALMRTDETIADLRMRLTSSEQERREAQRLLTHQTEGKSIADSTPSTEWLLVTTLVSLVALIGLAVYAFREHLG